MTIFIGMISELFERMCAIGSELHIRKAPQKLGWHPTYSLDDGLRIQETKSRAAFA